MAQLEWYGGTRVQSFREELNRAQERQDDSSPIPASLLRRSGTWRPHSLPCAARTPAVGRCGARPRLLESGFDGRRIARRKTASLPSFPRRVPRSRFARANNPPIRDTQKGRSSAYPRVRGYPRSQFRKRERLLGKTRRKLEQSKAKSADNLHTIAGQEDALLTFIDTTSRSL